RHAKMLFRDGVFPARHSPPPIPIIRLLTGIHTHFSFPAPDFRPHRALPMTNPFREDLVSRSRPEPCTVVIFGATGDLTHRKLVPALYNLAVDGELPPGVKIIGFARREKSDA